MSDAAPDPPPTRPMRWPVVIGVGVLALGAAAWLERRPVIRHFVDDTLARNHVPARYTLADVGLGRQRLTDVVIGDPAHPDLVADWIETEVSYGLTGPRLTGVSAGRVRLHGRLENGRLSLGAIDRLLPVPSGKGPIALPAVALAIADGRLRLETPAGPVGVALRGSGRLDGGFAGWIAAVAPMLSGGGCTIGAPRAIGAVTILPPEAGATRLRFRGPLQWDAARCRHVVVAGGSAAIDATLSSRAMAGQVALAVGGLRSSLAAADRLSGKVTLAGTPTAPRGMVDLVADRVRGRGMAAVAVTSSGRYALADPAFAGTIGWRGLAVPAATRSLAAVAVPAGMPITPPARRLVAALRSAAAAIDGHASIRATQAGVTIDQAAASSRSGARFSAAGPLFLDRDGLRGNGKVVLSGGGLPDMWIDLAMTLGQARGVVHVARYTAGDAAIEPITLRVALDDDGWRATGDVTLSGPFATGRVERLTLPIVIAGRGGRVSLFPGCAPIGAERLTVGTLTLAHPAATLCPVGSAVVTIDHGRVATAARLAPLRLGGSLGGSPLTLVAGGGTIGGGGFVLDRVAVALGLADKRSRLDIARLTGSLAGGAATGRFSDAAGNIGAVPLALSNAAADWRFAHGTLALTGALTVADAANPASACTPPFGADAPRFCPLEARDVRLTLANGRIVATGALYAPGTTVRVADVTLRHDLASGVGNAGLTVPDLTFTKDFQPDRLTPATFGIVADIKGSVTGTAEIDWNDARVTSTGRFTTKGLDLAAAFGPVTGISGTIDFDDLLALATPPGQVLKVASINPGVAVTDGTVTYQLKPGSIVAVEGARWPFAGGTLTLDPTTLDLAHPVAKRLTFRVDGMQAAQFLQQFDFKNLDATGTFDGTLPMVFDEAGGRIEKGELAVRQGGGTIAYVGDLTEKDLGFWGNLAFQALKSLRYRSLAIQMNGPLAGEMVTGVRFAGVQQGKGAHANFLVRRLEQLPFVFNITIRAPFRGLIDSAQSLYDPRNLVDRLLPAPSATQAPSVQPGASAPRP